MEETFSDEFKRFFLIKFTGELIKHSVKRDIIKLQKIIEMKEKKKRERLISKKKEQFILEQGELKREEPTVGGIAREQGTIKPQLLMKSAVKQIARPPLLIPEPKLPSHLEYLKPVPAITTEIDLFKLNQLIKDPAVRIIEGNPDEKVRVTGAMGTKQADIVLNKEDIDRIINRFSELSKIPVSEGVYRVAVGNLILSAVISEIIGSKFVIKKVIAPPANRQPYPPMNNRFPINRQRFPAIPIPSRGNIK